MGNKIEYFEQVSDNGEIFCVNKLINDMNLTSYYSSGLVEVYLVSKGAPQRHGMTLMTRSKFYKMKKQFKN